MRIAARATKPTTTMATRAYGKEDEAGDEDCTGAGDGCGTATVAAVAGWVTGGEACGGCTVTTGDAAGWGSGRAAPGGGVPGGGGGGIWATGRAIV